MYALQQQVDGLRQRRADMNPPRAWAVRNDDEPTVAEQCWTHGSRPGRNAVLHPFLHFFWFALELLEEQEAAKSLWCICRQHRHRSRKMVEASGGYDLPAFEIIDDTEGLAEQAPPKGHASTIQTLESQPDCVESLPLRAAEVAQTTISRPHSPNVPEILSGRLDGEDAGLGVGECEGFMRAEALRTSSMAIYRRPPRRLSATDPQTTASRRRAALRPQMSSQEKMHHG